MVARLRVLPRRPSSHSIAEPHEALSSAKFRRRTFTLGSPNIPRVRASVCCCTNSRTRSSGILRAAATRGTWSAAAAGEMSGSSPLPEVVTRSAGIAPPTPSARSSSTLPLMRSASALLVGPRLEPEERRRCSRRQRPRDGRESSRRRQNFGRSGPSRSRRRSARSGFRSPGRGKRSARCPSWRAGREARSGPSSGR